MPSRTPSSEPGLQLLPRLTSACRNPIAHLTPSPGTAWGLEVGRERVPPRWPACREHPSTCGELGMLWGTRAIGGQHDVRDGAQQELAPPHTSPLIRATLGQHKFFMFTYNIYL